MEEIMKELNTMTEEQLMMLLAILKGEVDPPSAAVLDEADVGCHLG